MLDMLNNAVTNVTAFVFALGVIIFVHEMGHLVVAKVFRVDAKVFSLGFGKRLWGFERGGTDYRVSLVPLGGYVQMSGEDPGVVGDDPGEFLNKPRWQRVLIYLAGPVMNIFLAIVLIAIVFMIGIEVAAPPDLPAVVGSVRPESPAADAGLTSGDEILSIDAKPMRSWDEVRFAFLTSPERRLAVEYRRGEEVLTTAVTPLKVPRYEFGDAGVFPNILPRIAGLVPGDPAERAGFQVGDEVRVINGKPIAARDEFVDTLAASPGQQLAIEILRGGTPVELMVTPEDRGGRGWIGVSLNVLAFQRYGPIEAVAQSARFNWDVTRQTFSVLGKILSGRLAAKGALSGPIEIGALAGAAARTGFPYLINLMGVISISIAILNLLPIPLLDGGQITVLAIESLARRDLSLRVKERINQVGFLLIVMLMAMVLYFDVVKNIPEGILPGS